MADILPGTISAMEECLFSFINYGKCCLVFLIEPWSSLIFDCKFFFSFLNSFTSLVRLTVYLLSLIIIVFLIVSSIFLSLFVFTTWLIRWSLLPVLTSIFYSVCLPSYSCKLNIPAAYSENTCLLWHLWKHSSTSIYA